MVAEPCEVGPVGVEYLVRAARVTGIDRLVALRDDAVRMSRAGGTVDLLVLDPEHDAGPHIQRSVTAAGVASCRTT